MRSRWDKFFLNTALTCAGMSKDPNTRVGAVIVGPDLEIRSTGFNGLPRGLEDTSERLHNRETKLRLTLHAEVNAILNAARIGVSVKGCFMFLAATDDTGLVWGGPPCVNCSLHVIQAGIVEVYSPPPKAMSKWAAELAEAARLLHEAGVDYRSI